MDAMKHFEQQSHYELLEVPVTASEDEILDAYARAMETYSPDSVAVYTLVDPDQLEVLRQQLTQAMEVLCSLEQRTEYDRKIGVTRSPEEGARLRAESLKRAAGDTAGKALANGAGETPAAQLAPAAQDRPAVEDVLLDVEVVTTEEVVPAAARTQASEQPAPEVQETQASEPADAAATTNAEASSERAASPVPPVAPTPAASLPVSRSLTPMPGSMRPAAHARPTGPLTRRGSALPPPLPSRNGARFPARPEPGSPRAPLRPPAGQQLGEAPVLAQESAIATAESALAQVAVKARDSRTRLKTVVDIPSDAEFNGELLRQVREGRNISLQMLADRTRISSRHVENIEADRYDSLPAGVYLRGMLMSIARELGLDPLRVSRSYMGLVASGEKNPR